MRLVLASGSPRRRRLLRALWPDLVVVPSVAVERAGGSPEEDVADNARAKAEEVAGRDQGVIIGADTEVVCGESVLGKPASRSDAAAMLRRLSGGTHKVITALHVIDTRNGRRSSAVERTQVSFRAVGDEEIERYLDRGEYADKAGGYGIQGAAALFVERIDGDYYNVMGLPLCRLGAMLEAFGVSLLDAAPPRGTDRTGGTDG